MGRGGHRMDIWAVWSSGQNEYYHKYLFKDKSFWQNLSKLKQRYENLTSSLNCPDCINLEKWIRNLLNHIPLTWCWFEGSSLFWNLQKYWSFQFLLLICLNLVLLTCLSHALGPVAHPLQLTKPHVLKTLLQSSILRITWKHLLQISYTVLWPLLSCRELVGGAQTCWTRKVESQQRGAALLASLVVQ